jgi:hypothetical protein
MPTTRAFYTYWPDANNFAALGAPSEWHDEIVRIHFQDVPLASMWAPLQFHPFDDNPPEQGDFLSLNDYGRIPVMSVRAWDALQSLIDYCCEPLPIFDSTGKTFYLIHVMDTIGCLDESRSKLVRNEVTGRVSRIFNYALKMQMLHGKHIFKLPLECGAELIVDDHFRAIVDSNELRGLIFNAIPLIQ